MAEDTIRIDRREERLEPRTEPVLKGHVRVKRRVVDEPQSVDLDVSRHEVMLERRAVDRPLAASEQTVQTRDGATILLVVEERLEVRKVPWVVEEIRLGRRVATERRRVTDTVRREKVDVEADGDLELADTDKE